MMVWPAVSRLVSQKICLSELDYVTLITLAKNKWTK